MLTEVLRGESEPLLQLLFLVLWARDVPKRRVSYTGSTLLPQAAEEGTVLSSASHLPPLLGCTTCHGTYVPEKGAGQQSH